jgi:NDP-sugar pyrophosphorylase family protein
MQCVILAGGLGTRMLPRTESVPKVLLPVLDRPFVDWQLEWLAGHGVTEVVFCVGRFAERVEAYCGSRRFGLPLSYVDEGEDLRGTAGALRLALERGALAEAFLLTYGDSYLRVDFAAVGRAFAASGAPALMTVYENAGRWDTSNVVFDRARGVVTLYDKARTLRPPNEYRHIDYGLSAFRRELVAERVPSDRKMDLAEVLQPLSLEGGLAGYEVFERFYEIGSPAGLADLERYLLGQ